MFAEIGCVFLRGSRSAISVLVCWPRRVCVLRCSRLFAWLLCKGSMCDCLVDFLRVSEKTGCSSGFRVNQYKHLCAISLSLISLNSVLFVVCWYKQPIVSVKQLIVFLVLQFLLAVLGN